jgi:8-oxo-dGTP pyrophosphatase MutT (NUDIX family)
VADLLESTTNPFGGVVTRPDGLPQDPDRLRLQLADSVAAWKAQGSLAVWMEVPISLSQLIPVAVEAGFTFHHSGDDYLMMIHRIVPGTYLPPYATHYIGAGGVVINEAGELLVVREKYGFRGRPAQFKLPGGALLEGEHLVDALEREVLEETGVRTKFESLVCFRHWHQYRYGKSDIYFVCRLNPLSSEIVMQAEEIAECRWLPVADFMASGDIGTFNKTIVQAALDSPGIAPSWIDGFIDRQQGEFFMPQSSGPD